MTLKRRIAGSILQGTVCTCHRRGIWERSHGRPELMENVSAVMGRCQASTAWLSPPCIVTSRNTVVTLFTWRSYTLQNSRQKPKWECFLWLRTSTLEFRTSSFPKSPHLRKPFFKALRKLKSFLLPTIPIKKTRLDRVTWPIKCSFATVPDRAPSSTVTNNKGFQQFPYSLIIIIIIIAA